ncbi:non-ribosomal peptide synthetase, partial [Aeromonas diversa]
YLRHYHPAESPILDCQFNPGYFTFKDGVVWVDRLISIIRKMLLSPDLPLKEVCLLTDDEKLLYRTINDNYKPKSASLISNIYHHSITNPSKMAIITEDGDSHTYNELWCLVLERVGVFNQLGVKNGDSIVLALPRGIEFIVNLLAANYLGATYVPIQENIPPVRLCALLKKVNANMLVSDRKLDLAPELSINVYTPSDLCSINPELVSLKKIGIEKGNYIAYVLFTSGSTGEPKGVLINSAARDNFLEGCCNTVSLSRESIVIAATAPTFDISVLELLGPLYTGGSCVIANEITKRQGHLLAALIAKYNVTHVQGTPTTWKLLLQAGWTPPNKITALVGGEPLPQDVALSLSKRCGLVFNMYGPTEATVWVMAKPVAGEEAVEPIGNLLQNCEAYVLDSELRILPPGVEGELALAGCCLSDGYCGATELTASRFPYHSMGKRIYLTGDRVKLNTNSQFKFIGRTDNQIKRRGFRIELGDIESSCTMHPMVQHVAAALAVGNEGEEKKIVLLYQGDISEVQFMTWIKEQLTDYMYPDFLQMCNSWPVNGSDKTDRTRLTRLIDLTLAKPWGCIDLESHVPSLESVDLEVVERLHTLWKSILKRDVNITANFLDCGGNSLQAQILLDKIRSNFPSSIPDTFIFICPSITAQAQFLTKDKLPVKARTQDGSKNHTRNNLLGKRRVVLEVK